jgi:hypothetical protein
MSKRVKLQDMELKDFIGTMRKATNPTQPEYLMRTDILKEAVRRCREMEKQTKKDG